MVGPLRVDVHRRARSVDRSGLVEEAGGSGEPQESLAVHLLQLRTGADAHAQVANQAIIQTVDPAMDSNGLSPLPGGLHDRRLAHIHHLFDHVQLT